MPSAPPALKKIGANNMTVVVERFGRERTSDPSSTLKYYIYGTDDDATAEAALSASVPILFDGLPMTGFTMEEVGPSQWFAEVKFTKRERKEKEVGESRYTFDTTGGTTKRMVSISTVAQHKVTGWTLGSFCNLINVSMSNGRAEILPRHDISSLNAQISTAEAYWTEGCMK